MSTNKKKPSKQEAELSKYNDIKPTQLVSQTADKTLPMARFNVTENKDIINGLISSPYVPSEQGKAIRDKLQRLRDTESRESQLIYLSEVIYNFLETGATTTEIAKALGLSIGQTREYINYVRKYMSESVAADMSGNFMLAESLRARNLVQTLASKTANVEFTKFMRMHEDPQMLLDKVNELRESGMQSSEIKMYMRAFLPNTRLLSEAIKLANEGVTNTVKIAKDMGVLDASPVRLSKESANSRERAEQIRRQLELEIEEEM
jgi:hypothetical protein